MWQCLPQCLDRSLLPGRWSQLIHPPGCGWEHQPALDKIRVFSPESYLGEMCKKLVCLLMDKSKYIIYMGEEKSSLFCSFRPWPSLLTQESGLRGQLASYCMRWAGTPSWSKSWSFKIQFCHVSTTDWGNEQCSSHGSACLLQSRTEVFGKAVSRGLQQCTLQR